MVTADPSFIVASDTSPTDTSGSGILLGLAREAMHDGRLVAPAGSNACAFYLSLLPLEPKDRTAEVARIQQSSVTRSP